MKETQAEREDRGHAANEQADRIRAYLNSLPWRCDCGATGESDNRAHFEDCPVFQAWLDRHEQEMGKFWRRLRAGFWLGRWFDFDPGEAYRSVVAGEVVESGEEVER